MQVIVYLYVMSIMHNQKSAYGTELRHAWVHVQSLKLHIYMYRLYTPCGFSRLYNFAWRTFA